MDFPSRGQYGGEVRREQVHVDQHGGAASAAELRRGVGGGTEAELYDDHAGDGDDRRQGGDESVVLVPKSAEMRKQILRITLWIPEGQTNALKERVDKPAKNYTAWTYSSVNLKDPVPDSAVTLKLPQDVHGWGK